MTGNNVMEYRQIITKAVCGRGRKFSQSVHSVRPPENVYTVLGAWVINHKYACKSAGEEVEVKGSYDVNIWYSTKGNTKTDVIKETIHYKENVPLSYLDTNATTSKSEIKAAVTQTPNCLEASIASGGESIVVKVEKEFVVEMLGETKVCVPVYPLEIASYDEKCQVSDLSDELSEQGFDDLDPSLLVDDLED